MYKGRKKEKQKQMISKLFFFFFLSGKSVTGNQKDRSGHCGHLHACPVLHRPCWEAFL